MWRTRDPRTPTTFTALVVAAGEGYGRGMGSRPSIGVGVAWIGGGGKMRRGVGLRVLFAGLTVPAMIAGGAASSAAPADARSDLSGGYRIALEGCAPPYCGVIPPNESNIFLENLNGHGRREVTNGDLLYYSP